MRRPSTRAVLNTTSMLDVIFILLIFFVAVSKLRDGSIDLRLPGAEGKASGTVPQELVVSVDRKDRLSLNGSPVASEKELVEHLRRRHGTGANRRVVFAADRDSRSGKLVAALKAVTDSGFRDVSFVYEPRGERR